MTTGIIEGTGMRQDTKLWSMDRVISEKPRKENRDSRLGPAQHKCELLAEHRTGMSGPVEFGSISAWIRKKEIRGGNSADPARGTVTQMAGQDHPLDWGRVTQ